MSWRSLLILLEVLTLAQAGPPGKPTPPPLPSPTVQSAVIRGTVVNYSDGSPISGVKISVMVPGRGGIVGSDTSDANGHYEIHVPPEKYAARATKDGFVAQTYRDVANFPVFQANAGQETVADFRMLPGAAISGRVMDTYGSPTPNVSVRANIMVYSQGKVDVGMRASAQTNPQGPALMFFNQFLVASVKVSDALCGKAGTTNSNRPNATRKAVVNIAK